MGVTIFISVYGLVLTAMLVVDVYPFPNKFRNLNLSYLLLEWECGSGQGAEEMGKKSINLYIVLFEPKVSSGYLFSGSLLNC